MPIPTIPMIGLDVIKRDGHYQMRRYFSSTNVARGDMVVAIGPDEVRKAEYDDKHILGIAHGSATAGGVVDVLLGGSMGSQFGVLGNAIRMSSREKILRSYFFAGCDHSQATAREISAMVFIASAFDRYHTIVLRGLAFRHGGDLVRASFSPNGSSAVIHEQRISKTLSEIEGDARELARRAAVTCNVGSVPRSIDGIPCTPLWDEWVDVHPAEVRPDLTPDDEFQAFVAWFLGKENFDVARDVERMGDALRDILR